MNCISPHRLRDLVQAKLGVARHHKVELYRMQHRRRDIGIGNTKLRLVGHRT